MATFVEYYNNLIHAGDPYVRQFFLLRSIKPMIFMVVTYVIFVTYLGPSFMKSRKPFQMRKLIILYNFFLVAYYAFFLLKGAYFVFKLGLSTFCDSTLDSSSSPLIASFYYHGYVMYAMRFVELVDTVFLVLSKKNKMITPLHVFHHSIVPVFGWYGFRSEKSAYLSAFMAINSLVHIIMYTYYAIAALGPEYQKYLWWKKYLTTLQITQFFIMTLYLLIMNAIGCVTSKLIIGGSVFLCVLFFFWFILYYRQTFIKPKAEKIIDYHNGPSELNQKLLEEKTK